jgi:amino acid transporter
MFALTAAAPLMVVGALVSTGWGVVGTTGFPLAFVIIAIVLALFSFGYVAMSRHITNAGAFYSYIAQGLGRPLGVGGALVALLAYNLLQVGLYGAFGAFLSQLLADKAGWNVKWWILALVLWLFVAVLGLLRVDVNSKVLMVLLGAELIVVTVFDVIFLSHPAGGSVSFEPWTWGALKDAVGPAFAVAVTAFVGFEAAPVFAEEARSKNRTVAAATFLGLGVMLLSYALTSWAASASIGVDATVKAAQDTLATGGPFFPAVAQAGGAWAGDVGSVLLITSVAAAALSYHNTTARYAFALGRERVLPSFFGRTRARSGAPASGSLFQTLIGLVVILLFAVQGWDPLVNLFFWLGTAGGVGVLLLVTATLALGDLLLRPGRPRRGGVGPARGPDPGHRRPRLRDVAGVRQLRPAAGHPAGREERRDVGVPGRLRRRRGRRRRLGARPAQPQPAGLRRDRPRRPGQHRPARVVHRGGRGPVALGPQYQGRSTKAAVPRGKTDTAREAGGGLPPSGVPSSRPRLPRGVTRR